MSHEELRKIPLPGGRRMTARLVLLLGLWMASLAVCAEQAPPPPGETDQSLEPEVTIVDRGEELVEEYRINGRLYMIKVIPKKGIPYFLVDSDGDGSFDVRRNELDEELLIPQWILFRW